MIPKSINIGGRKITVKRQAMDDYGNYFADLNLITIDENLEDEEAMRTLIHEMLHAALFIGGTSYSSMGGDSEKEEGVVRNIENIALPAILEIIRANTKKERRVERVAAKKKSGKRVKKT